MKRSEVKQALSKFNRGKEKEDFLSKSKIKFTHDSFQNLIIWCSDGVLALRPIWKNRGRKNGIYKNLA